MTHDEPCSMAPDDKHDLISGTCSHLPFKTTIAGQPFVLQEILDKICVGLIPLLLVLGCLKLLNKKVSPNKVLIMLIVFGFAAAGIGII
uniref:PTS system mannose/fructose/sorbose family transporter subunit IID n=1 Tax=Klebsiella michiganensis TaxID=1134687 RepID=UPI000C7E536F|nr:PTS system mannose/fructose/sorbose family transporter subunit IID [Klebsiella michiganensis]